jgi:hypothetical protein
MWVMWVHLPLFAPFWSCDVRMKMIWPEVRWWPERLSGLSLTGSENIESKWVRVSSCESISTYFNIFQLFDHRNECMTPLEDPGLRFLCAFHSERFSSKYCHARPKPNASC